MYKNYIFHGVNNNENMNIVNTFMETEKMSKM